LQPASIEVQDAIADRRRPASSAAWAQQPDGHRSVVSLALAACAPRFDHSALDSPIKHDRAPSWRVAKAIGRPPQEIAAGDEQRGFGIVRRRGSLPK